MQQKEQLRAQLRKTLFTYAHEIPVNVVLGELRRLSDELTQIALQTTDTSAAISAFAIDAHGNVQERGKRGARCNVRQAGHLTAGKNMDKNMVVYGRQSIKNIWFVGLKAVLDYFSECVKLGEKMRIVIEYDPRAENTTIIYYRATQIPAQNSDL